MVTKTIYTDPYMVVVDIGAVNPTEAWLQETTYLIDQAGSTTAMIAQTDQPTMGVSLQPVPFTPVNAQVSPAAQPTTTSSAATPEPAKPNTSRTVIALVAVGVILGVVVMSVSLYLLRRRALKQRLQAQSGSPSGNFAASASSTSSNSLDNLFDDFKTSQGVGKALFEEESMPSWETFLEEVKRGYRDSDGNHIPPGEGSGPMLDASSGLEDMAELKAKYEQLLAHHQSTSATGGLVTIKAHTSKTRQAGKEPGVFVQPTSILKRPGHPAGKGARLTDAVQGILGVEEKEGMQNFVERKAAGMKKKVTFGKAEIREFGRTPLPSIAGSTLGRNNIG